MNMKHVLIRYTVKDDVDLDELSAGITRFVAGLKETSADILYTSYRLGEDTRDFAHVGFFPSKEVLADVQSKPFFGEFASFLKERCADGPGVTFMAQVASTFMGQ